MSTHLTHQQLNAYLQQTSSDAQRETLDVHLTSCSACRARLNELDVLQQRVRRELAAELRAVNVPLSLTFETIAPQLKHRGALAFRRFAMRLTAAVAATAAIVVLVMLVNSLTPAPTSTVSVLTLNQATNFFAFGANTLADGWFLAGNAPQNYETGIDQAVTYAGKSSGYISSTVLSSEGFGTWMQMFKADAYRGMRLRLSAYVKAENVKDWAGLWMRIDGQEHEVLGFDNMQNRPIRGTVDWQPVVIILDVPQNSVDIAFGILLHGVGRVWIDNVQFEVAGADVPTTAIQVPAPTSVSPLSIEMTPAPQSRTIEPQPTNLDFETGSAGWSTADSDTREYISGIDPTMAHLGQASGSIVSLVPKPGGLGLLHQTVKAHDYRDKRVRVSGYIRADRLDGGASFLLIISGQEDQMIYANSRSIDGPTGWRRFEFVLNVPVNSDRIEYGLALRGEGQAWIDDVRIEFVGDDIEISSFEASPIERIFVGPDQPDNLDFESSPYLQSWFNGGNADYEEGIDHNVFHTGNSSAYLKSKQAVNTGSYEVLSQFIKADDYRGRRLRLSGYIKTDQVEGWAGIWMNIADSGNQLLGLDNMQNRPITGTTDWGKYEIVLDIPGDGAWIGLGALLQGRGEIWLDDVNLEVVGQDVPTTNPYQQQPLNLDFENTK